MCRPTCLFDGGRGGGGGRGGAATTGANLPACLMGVGGKGRSCHYWCRPTCLAEGTKRGGEELPLHVQTYLPG